MRQIYRTPKRVGKSHFYCKVNKILTSFAYIEFADKDSVQTATALDESLFKGRQIKVCMCVPNVLVVITVTHFLSG